MDEGSIEARKIVVGIDGSPAAATALRWAADEAVLSGSPLRIVHVWTPPVSAWPLPTGMAYGLDLDAAESLVADAADSVAGRLEAKAPPTSTAVVTGLPVSALLDEATDASMLVVGRRGAGGFHGLVMGAVSSSLIHHARVPTVVVGSDQLPGSGDVMVGVDDSEGGHRAFAWAADEALRLERKLVVVHGWDTPVAVPPGGVAFEPLPVGTHDEMTDHLIDRLVNERVDAGLPCPDIERRAVGRTAPEALVHESDRAALLVVGSRGRGVLAGALLGSVSRQVVHHARCPVVIVPRPPEER